MSILTKDKVTEIFCIADDFCKELEKSDSPLRLESPDGKKHRNRACMMSDSEIITILVCFHMGTLVISILQSKISVTLIMVNMLIMLYIYCEKKKQSN